MSASWVLQSANLGGSFLTSTFGAVANAKIAGAQGKIERNQIKFAAEAQANARTDAYLRLRGSQQAAIGASGRGGRTSRLLLAQSAKDLSYANQYASVSKQNALTQSRFTEGAGKLSALAGGLGGALDLFSGVGSIVESKREQEAAAALKAKKPVVGRGGG